MQPSSPAQVIELTLQEAKEIVHDAAMRDASRLADGKEFYIQMEAIRIVSRHIDNSPEDYS